VIRPAAICPRCDARWGDSDLAGRSGIGSRRSRHEQAISTEPPGGSSSPGVTVGDDVVGSPVRTLGAQHEDVRSATAICHCRVQAHRSPRSALPRSPRGTPGCHGSSRRRRTGWRSTPATRPVSSRRRRRSCSSEAVRRLSRGRSHFPNAGLIAPSSARPMLIKRLHRGKTREAGPWACTGRGTTVF